MGATVRRLSKVPYPLGPPYVLAMDVPGGAHAA
jgi:hypothetical protein